MSPPADNSGNPSRNYLRASSHHALPKSQSRPYVLLACLDNIVGRVRYRGDYLVNKLPYKL